MSEFDHIFDPNILIGHCDLISRLSDFALYLSTRVVYEQTSFMIGLGITRPLSVKCVTFSTLSWYFFILLSDYE